MKLSYIIKGLLNLLILAHVLCLISTSTFATTPSCGTVDKRLLARPIKAHQNAIRACYETALLKNKSLKGKITLAIYISPDGKADPKLFATTLQNREVEQCVIDVVKSIKFSTYFNKDCTPTRTLIYPFVFEPTSTHIEYRKAVYSAHLPYHSFQQYSLIINEDEIIVEDIDPDTYKAIVESQQGE